MRVLVVDDTIVYRKVVSDILAEIPGVEVAGTASNGKIALSRIEALKPDIVTLDIEMPEMGGLEVLSNLRRDWPRIGAIVLSNFTREGGDMTMKALELGAFDFISKPQGGSPEENRKHIARLLGPMLKSYMSRREIHGILRGAAPGQPQGNRGKTGESPEHRPASRARTAASPVRNVSEIVAIGISTGGPNALARVLPQLPSNLGVPVLIVQHMPPIFTQSLAKSLNAKCALEVREAADGDPVESNVILIAPGGKQMKVAASNDKRFIRITDDPPENSCRPSVDYLFRSIAHLYPGRATGVIMTGMGADGVLGLKLLKRTGCLVIAQDEASSTVYGMPKEAFDAGVVDVVASIEHIAAEIRRTIKAVSRC